jgi:hypothetical protein
MVCEDSAEYAKSIGGAWFGVCLRHRPKIGWRKLNQEKPGVAGIRCSNRVAEFEMAPQKRRRESSATRDQR